MDAISLKYGSLLETLSTTQKYALLSLIASRSCSPESLPDDLVNLVCLLSHNGELALMESLVTQLRQPNPMPRVEVHPIP